jgi:hypothetical protein
MFSQFGGIKLSLSTTPLRCIGEWRYRSAVLDVGTDVLGSACTVFVPYAPISIERVMLRK